MSSEAVPIIDLSPLFDATFTPTSTPSAAASACVAAIDSAFRTWGIFQASSPLPSSALSQELVRALSRFFALPEEKKRALDLRHGGWAWRGYMPFKGEATKGRHDQKEGFYGGPEHNGHELDGLPTYGKNQFPDQDVPEMRPAVLEYTERVTELGCMLCDAMSLALGLDKDYIRGNILDKPDPVQLFRSFHYIGKENDGKEDFGIGEHSDFGLLTILSAQGPGLEVLSPAGNWTPVPHIPGSLIINVGDILDRLTLGVYISPKHRVVLPSPSTTRLSIPFFFDPAWNAVMKPFPLPASTSPTDETVAAAEKRWLANTTFRKLDGVWGQYLGVKVKKVFPDLELPAFDAVERGSGRHVLVVRKEREAARL